MLDTFENHFEFFFESLGGPTKTVVAECLKDGKPLYFLESRYGLEDSSNAFSITSTFNLNSSS